MKSALDNQPSGTVSIMQNSVQSKIAGRGVAAMLIACKHEVRQPAVKLNFSSFTKVFAALTRETKCSRQRDIACASLNAVSQIPDQSRR